MYESFINHQCCVYVNKYPRRRQQVKNLGQMLMFLFFPLTVSIKTNHTTCSHGFKKRPSPIKLNELFNSNEKKKINKLTLCGQCSNQHLFNSCKYNDLFTRNGHIVQRKLSHFHFIILHNINTGTTTIKYPSSAFGGVKIIANTSKTCHIQTFYQTFYINNKLRLLHQYQLLICIYSIDLCLVTIVITHQHSILLSKEN